MSPVGGMTRHAAELRCVGVLILSLSHLVHLSLRVMTKYMLVLPPQGRCCQFGVLGILEPSGCFKR